VPDVLYTETIPASCYAAKAAKIFSIPADKSADASIMAVRSIKSKYELEIMKKLENSPKILEQRVPELLEEGMSESDLAPGCLLY
jgi:Xaa-Pro dipeptidase